MANNLIQVKRTSVSGRAANSTTLPNPGELALNMTDGILYSTNGSVVFEIGANNTNATITNTLTAGNGVFSGNVSISGNLVVNGGIVSLTGNVISFTDNMLYLNQGVEATITNITSNGTHVVFTADNNYSPGWDVFVSGVNPSSYNKTYNNIFAANSTTFTVADTNTDSYVGGGTARGKTDQNPDLGIAAGYNDGTYHHTGIFRDASDGKWKVFDNYGPEPDASPYIDTANSTFHLADFQANTLYLGNTSTNWLVANTSEIYHSGAANSATLLVRGAATVNGTLTVNTISANGGLGTTGQALYTDGTKVFWNTVPAVNVDAQYVWTNSHTFEIAVTFGNSTINSTVNSTFFTGQSNTSLNANSAAYIGSLPAANVVSNSQLQSNLANYQTTAGLSANVATLTSNNSTYAFGKTEGSLNVNNALYLGGVAAASYQLNSTLNANIASYLPNYTGVVNASSFTVGPNFIANSTQVVAADVLVTGNLVVNGTTVTLNTATLDVTDLNITVAKGTPDAASANGAGITVDGANATLLYVNAGNTWLSNINFGVGNSTSNVSINSTAFIGNVVATAISGNLTGNVVATVISSGNTTITGYANVSGTLSAGDTTITGFINATSTVNASAYYSGTLLVANSSVINATHLGGLAAADYQTEAGLSANVATLTSNNTSFVGSVSAANVVSNSQLQSNLANYQTTAGLSANVATLTSNNATNLGGIAASNYARTDVAEDFGALVTFNANAALTKSLSANGEYGSAGQVLTSGGTGNVYWATPEVGDITSVTAGNGLTGGGTTGDVTLTVGAGDGITVNTTAVAVLPNTGIVANATGVYVNAAYINTISSNSATYANASVTNTFTVGTGSYFVSNGNVGVGNSAPANKLSVNGTSYLQGNVTITGALIANGSAGAEGQILASNSSGLYWKDDVLSAAAVSLSFVDDQFTGDGSTNSYTLSVSSTTNNAIVSINGVLQEPIDAYTISGTTLTFSENIANNASIDVRIPNFVAGGFVGSANNLTTSNTSEQVVDSFSITEFRSASYFVQVTDNTNLNYHAQNITLVHNGSAVFMSEYGAVYSNGSSLATFDANITGGAMSLTVVPVTANSTVKVIRTTVTV